MAKTKIAAYSGAYPFVEVTKEVAIGAALYNIYGNKYFI